MLKEIMACYQLNSQELAIFLGVSESFVRLVANGHRRLSAEQLSKVFPIYQALAWADVSHGKKLQEDLEIQEFEQYKQREIDKIRLLIYKKKKELKQLQQKRLDCIKGKEACLAELSKKKNNRFFKARLKVIEEKLNDKLSLTAINQLEIQLKVLQYKLKLLSR